MLTWLICSYYGMIRRNVYLSPKSWSIPGSSNIEVKQAQYKKAPECYTWHDATCILHLLCTHCNCEQPAVDERVPRDTESIQSGSCTPLHPTCCISKSPHFQASSISNKRRVSDAFTEKCTSVDQRLKNKSPRAKCRSPKQRRFLRKATLVQCQDTPSKFDSDTNPKSITGNEIHFGWSIMQSCPTIGISSMNTSFTRHEVAYNR